MEYNVGDKVDTEVGIGALAAVANGCAKISSSRICIEYRDLSTSDSTFYEVALSLLLSLHFLPVENTNLEGTTTILSLFLKMALRP